MDNAYLKAIKFLQDEIETNNQAYIRYGTRGAATHMVIRLIELRDDYNAQCLSAIDALHYAWKESQGQENGDGEQKVLDIIQKAK
jgi:hypothetical protein